MTPTRHAAADENVDPNAEERQPISSLTIALFVLGCAMLVAESDASDRVDTTMGRGPRLSCPVLGVVVGGSLVLGRS